MPSYGSNNFDGYGEPSYGGSQLGNAGGTGPQPYDSNSYSYKVYDQNPYGPLTIEGGRNLGVLPQDRNEHWYNVVGGTPPNSGGNDNTQRGSYTPPSPTPWTVPGYPTPTNPFMMIGGGESGTGTGMMAQQAIASNPALGGTPGGLGSMPGMAPFNALFQGVRNVFPGMQGSTQQAQTDGGSGAAAVQAQAQQNPMYAALKANPYLNNTPGPMPQAPAPYQFQPPAPGLNLQSLMAMFGG